MKALLTTLTVPLLLGTSVKADAPPVPPLVITHAQLWTSRGVLPDHEIAIVDGQVAAVGESGRISRPAGARVIDAGGDTLLPGLIDAHVHLVQGSRLPPGLPKETVTSANARHLLRSGVTSGRIHLLPLPELQALKNLSSDAAPAPRLQPAGPAFFGGRPTWQDATENVWGVQSADDATEKVRRLHAAGAKWVALHDLDKFLPGEAEAIVAEGRRLGLGVLAAGDSIANVERALALGVDSIDYLDRSERDWFPPELLKQLSAAPQTFLVPLMGLPRRWNAYRAGEWSVDDPTLTEFLPPHAAHFTVAALAEDRAKSPSYKPRFDAAQISKFRELHASQLPLVVGTDCGSPAHFHADAIWWEMETWRQLGVTPDEIVRAATERAAQLLRDPSIGHLGVGARGDFLLYRGRLQDGPLHVQRVRTVAKGGRLFVEDGRWLEPGEAAPELKLEFATNAGPLTLTIQGHTVTGRYRISVKQPADEGTFSGTLRDGLLDAVWIEPDRKTSGRLLVAFNASQTEFHALYNTSEQIENWTGDWFGHLTADIPKLPAGVRAQLRSDWQ